MPRIAGGTRSEHRRSSATEKSLDPAAISPVRQRRTQSCAKQQANQAEDDDDRQADRNPAPILVERTETRRQEQNRKRKCEQQADPDAAIDHHADGCIAPIIAKMRKKPHPHAVAGDHGQDLPEKLPDCRRHSDPKPRQLFAAHRSIFWRSATNAVRRAGSE